jgi:Kdo2-lipid IVA lauroyltransferase/acyltransferase
MFYIVYSFFYLLSLLPLRVLYLVSDFFYLLLFYGFKYRKKIVLNNLEIAFPEKTSQERNAIAKKFYRNLTDSFVEIIKLFSASKTYINKHCKADFSIFEELYAENRDFHLNACHQFNWEWLNHHYSANIPQPLIGVYMPLSNRVFERIFLKIRNKYNTVMIPATNMKKSFSAWKQKNHVLVLVADQNPGDPSNAHWFKFFSKPAPFLKGPAKNAIEKKCPVVFANIIKERRGYYRTDFVLVTKDASEYDELTLTKLFVAYLQKNIAAQPENWLWSHRRWKWNWEEKYGTINEL